MSDTLTSNTDYRHAFLFAHSTTLNTPLAELAEIVPVGGTPVLTLAMAETMLAALQAAGTIETYRGVIYEVTGSVTVAYNPNSV